MTGARDPARLAERLADAAGGPAALLAVSGAPGATGEVARFAVDGAAPVVALAPSDAGGVAAALRVASELGLAVVPRGGGTAMGIGNAPARVDVVLSLERLRGVVYHAPADLVVSLAAGTPLADAARVLAEHGQELPLEPPGAEAGATVGGALASGLAGPRRLALGGPRERLLGARAALAGGEVVASGGRVTKNVAGYDLARLLAGSLGGLAVLLEATFKVSPRPERRAVATVAHRDLARVEALRARLLERGLPLAGLDLLSPRALAEAGGALGLDGAGEGWALAAIVEGPASRVARVLADARASVAERAAGATLAVREDDGGAGEGARGRAPGGARAALAALRDLPRAGDGARRLWVRLSVGPAASLDAAARAVAAAEAAGLDDARASGRAGNGVIDLVTTLSDGAAPATARALAADLDRLARSHRGSAAVLAAPPEVKAGLDVFGPPGPALRLERRVKDAFDPRGILSPGRGWGRGAR